MTTEPITSKEWKGLADEWQASHRADLADRKELQLGDIEYSEGIICQEEPLTVGTWDALGVGVLFRPMADGEPVEGIEGRDFSLLLESGEIAALIGFLSEILARGDARWREVEKI